MLLLYTQPIPSSELVDEIICITQKLWMWRPKPQPVSYPWSWRSAAKDQSSLYPSELFSVTKTRCHVQTGYWIKSLWCLDGWAIPWIVQGQLTMEYSVAGTTISSVAESHILQWLRKHFGMLEFANRHNQRCKLLLPFPILLFCNCKRVYLSSSLWYWDSWCVVFVHIPFGGSHIQGACLWNKTYSNQLIVLWPWLF